MFKRLVRGVEYDDETGRIFLYRCPKCYRENYILNVRAGICTWCGYDAHELLDNKDKVTINKAEEVSDNYKQNIINNGEEN